MHFPRCFMPASGQTSDMLLKNHRSLGQTGTRRHCVFMLSIRPFVRPSLRSFVRYETCEHDILKKNEPILMPMGTSGTQGKGMEWSTLGIRRSKIKVTRGRNRSQKSLLARYLQNDLMNFNQTYQAHIAVNVDCITTTRMQKVKGQGHTRPKAWQTHHSRVDHFGSSGRSFSILH